MILLAGTAAIRAASDVAVAADIAGETALDTVERPVSFVDASTARSAADALCAGEASVLVLDLAMSGAPALFERLRGGELGPSDRPVVLLADGGSAVGVRSFDAVLEKPLSEGELRSALERAIAVVTYRDALAALYERCRDRAAAGTADPLAEPAELATVRDDADRALAALDDPSVVADLLDGGRGS